MDSQHRIEWVVLTDGERIEVQKLGLTTNPIVRFSKMSNSGKLRAYAFCNIHGLWESEK
jgi:superoxide reductase